MRNQPRRLPFWASVAALYRDSLSFDSRLFRTFVPFQIRPGLLARTYNDGRRLYYSDPLRTFLFMGLLLGLSMFVRNLVAPESPQADAPLHVTLPIDRAGEARAPDAADSTAQDNGAGEPLTRPGESPAPSGFLEAFLIERQRHLDSIDPRLLNGLVMQHVQGLAPTIAFVLLPLFAAVLKLVFLGRGLFYTEHLVHALYLHAHAYLWLAVLVWLDSWWIKLGLAWLLIHFIASCRQAYRLNTRGALVRGVAGLLLYVPLLAIGMLGGALFALLLI